MKPLRNLTLASIVATVAFTFPAAAQDPMDGMAMDKTHEMSAADMIKTLASLKGKEFEISFLKEMIVHHRSAVAMAELVKTHTKRPELNQMAASIVADQQEEIGQMTTWLQTWYGQGPDGMEMPMHGMDKLQSAKDAEFDKLFLSMMTEHHQGALDMAKLVGSRADHAELKTLAQNIVKAQTEEIARMKSWEKAWF